MRSEVIDELVELMPKVKRGVIKGMSNPFLQGTLSIPQMFLLEIIHEKGQMTMTDLGKTMDITTSAVTGLIDRMIKTGTVVRKRGKADRRIVYIHLTEKGKIICRKMRDAHRKAMRDLFSSLSEKEILVYLNLMRKIYNNSVKNGI